MSRQPRLTILRTWLVLLTFLLAVLLAACSKENNKKTSAEASHVPAKILMFSFFHRKRRGMHICNSAM